MEQIEATFAVIESSQVRYYSNKKHGMALWIMTKGSAEVSGFKKLIIMSFEERLYWGLFVLG